MDSILINLMVQVVLIALNAIFACAEIALLNANDMKMAQLAAKKNKKAIKLQKLSESPAKFLAAIQVAITLSGFLGSAFAADNFASMLVDLVEKKGWNLPISHATLNTIAVVLITLVLSYFTLVFGELVPKRLAMKKADKLALTLVSLVAFVSKAFAPIVWLLTVSTNGILRIFGVNPDESDEEVTEEEIRLMVDAGSENGAIEEEEKEIIQNVFEFNDTTAGEIATHRTDISMLCAEDDEEAWKNIIHEKRHTFFPIYSETIDNIVGVLNAKDYFRLEEKTREGVMENAVKPPYFVPETVAADVLLRNMRQRKEYFAIVMDEYGGTSGIVTLTDLIGCIVGDIEYADGDADVLPTPEIEQIDEDTFSVSGLVPIDEVEKAIGEDLNEHDCDTISGYILGVIGSIPEDGTTLTTENDLLYIEVTEVKDHRIEKAILKKKPQPEKEEEEK